jgi:Ca2+-binding RTX toxin-like protein
MAAVTSAHQTAIANLYIALFNRAPDADGFAFWTQALANGASLDTISRNFVATPEARATYPESQSATDFVTAYYTNVLGRAPDANGLAFWTQALENAGGVGSDAARASIVSQIVDIVNTPLPEKPADISEAAYELTFADRNAFGNKGTVAVYFATEYRGTDLTLAKQVLAVVGPTPTTIDAAMALLKPPAGGGGTQTPDVAKHFVGIAGLDNFIGGSADDTFKFVIDNTVFGRTTLNPNDVAAGGAGHDTLTFETAGPVWGLDFAGTSFTDIESVVFARHGVSDVIFKAGPQVKSLTVEGGSGMASILNLRDGATFIVKDVALPGTMSANYGDAVAPDVQVSGANGVRLVVSTPATSTTLTSTGTASRLEGVDLWTSVTDLSIVADAAFSTGYIDGPNSVTVTVSGAGITDLGRLDRTAVSAVNASANTGGLIATLDANHASIVVTGSASDDTITTGSVVLTSGSVDAGGATGDRLIVTNSAAISDDKLGGKYTGFEILRALGDVTVDVGNVKGITAVELSASTGIATVTGVNKLDVAQAAAVSILETNASGRIVIGLADTSGTGDTVKAALTTTTDAGAARAIDLTGITLTDVETLELTGNGSVAASTGRVTLTTANATSLDKIVVKNAGGATITIDAAHTATNLVIDASGSSGAVTVDASAYSTATGVEIIGGAEGGTLTGSGKADTIRGGAGDDIIIGDRMLPTPGLATGEVQQIGLSGSAINSGTYTLGNHTTNLTSGTTPQDIVDRFSAGGAEHTAFSVANPTIDSLSYSPGQGMLTITYKVSAGDVPLITASKTAPGLSAHPTASDVTPYSAGAIPAPPVGNGTHDTLSGGGGANTFRFFSADSNVEHGTITTIITDFQTGIDKIDLTVTGPATIANYVEANAVAADLPTLLMNASAALDTTVRVYVGQVGNDSFVVSDLNGTGYTDVIQLTGVSLDRIAFQDFVAAGVVTPL